MNEQKAPNGIEWTRVVLADGSRTRGFTWNVFGGCRHACEWVMPDGKVAECYAKTVAERLAQEHYPQGFEAHYFHPKRLVEPGRQKNPAGIFLDSMADAMGHWVEEDQIKQVLDVCRATPQHIYFLLTKNAVRLPDFDFPENVWTGASSPPDRMFGKPLNRKKQEAMLRNTLFEQRRIVLGCYCAPRTFCHRHIAVGLLQKIGMKFGITVVQAGELEPQPEPKPDAPPQQLSLFDMKTYA